MLPPTQQRYANRIKELISQGENFETKPVNQEMPSYSPITFVSRSGAPRREPEKKYTTVEHFVNSREVTAWLLNVSNIVHQTFGENSLQWKRIAPLCEKHTVRPVEVNPILGVLEGALSDLEGGYLTGQEFLIAADVFDSALEAAKHLNETGYVDNAAVLGRVVLEDALRRLAMREGVSVINDGGKPKKASLLNTELKGCEAYNQPTWRHIDGWLDTGNMGAHPTDQPLTKDEVLRMLEGIEGFLSTYFTI